MKDTKELILSETKPSRGNENKDTTATTHDEPKTKLKLAQASHAPPSYYHDSEEDAKPQKTKDVKSKIRLADGSEELQIRNQLHLPETVPMRSSSSSQAAVVGSERINNSTNESQQLFQATAVDNDALRNELLNEITIHAEEVVQEEKGEGGKPSRSYYYKYCAVLTVVVLVLGLGLGLGLSRGSSKHGNLAIPSHIYDDEAEPTAVPSWSPTTTQTPTRSVLDWIEQVVMDNTRELSALKTPDSPQNLALNWLLQEDRFFIDTVPYSSTTQPSLVSPLEWDQMLLERFSLAALYYSTNGNGWNDDLGFLSPSLPVCDWNDGQQAIFFNGVSCYSSREPPFSVSTVVLAGNNLAGSLPWNELLFLSRLVTLNLEGNRIDGGIQWNDTTAIATSSNWSTSLETFNLARNPSLMGTLPSELGLMTNLKSISLWLTNLSGPLPPELSNCSTVETILLYANSLSGTLPSQWGEDGSFTSTLTSLSLWNNQLTGTIPDSWGNLTGLVTFGLDVNQLSGTVPTTFTQLSSLSDLYLENNQLEGDLDPLFCAPRGKNASSTWSIFWSDCLGDSPEVNCSCCTGCYDDFQCCYATVGADWNNVTPANCVDFVDANAISSYCL